MNEEVDYLIMASYNNVCSKPFLISPAYSVPRITNSLL